MNQDASGNQPIFKHESDDPAIVNESKQARQTFRYFWRELCWERRRIIPGLDLSAIKVAFSDGVQAVATSQDQPQVEQMWVSDVDFDGRIVSGTLLNQPNWLTSINEGDRVQIPPSRVNDWMYAIAGEVFGGYTVNTMRSQMGKGERRGHDRAWGLDFGDPSVISVVPEEHIGRKKKSGLGKIFGGKSQPQSLQELAAHEHPMALNMGASLVEMVQQNPASVHEADHLGQTFLHQMASAGSQSAVQIMLQHGADRNAVSKNGLTAGQLAKVLGWQQVLAVLG